MKNNTTELVFILDRSGSMAGLESDTIGGFNAMIEKQRGQEGACFVTTVLFDNESVMLHDRIPLEKVPRMTEADYAVRGCTALIDAIGGAVSHIADIHKYARPEDVPAHTLFVITTDGYENASQVYTSSEVKRMISDRKEKNGWEFLFIGANIDAVETAGRIGIPADRAGDYRANAKGTRAVFAAVADCASEMRACGAIATDWAAPIVEGSDPDPDAEAGRRPRRASPFKKKS